MTPVTGATPIVPPLTNCVQFFVKSAPALATGTVRSTVTRTLSVAVHPLAVLVTTSVYVVVVVGFAVGFATVVEDKPTLGVHAYVNPETEAAPI